MLLLILSSYITYSVAHPTFSTAGPTICTLGSASGIDFMSPVRKGATVTDFFVKGHVHKPYKTHTTITKKARHAKENLKEIIKS